MGGNSFGKIFRISTFGESHGAALGVIVDGCPAGLPSAFGRGYTALFREKKAGKKPEDDSKERGR